jgi:hypothetical protein
MVKNTGALPPPPHTFNGIVLNILPLEAVYPELRQIGHENKKYINIKGRLK